MKLVVIEQASSGIRILTHRLSESSAATALSATPDGDWLRDIMNSSGIQGVAVTLSGSDVITRRLAMPMMPKRELREAVRWQLKDELSFPVAEAAIEVAVLGDIWEKDIRKHDVLVAAAPRALVERTCAAAEQSGAQVTSVIPAPVALGACLTALVPEARHGSQAIVDVGASTTQIAILHNGRVRMARALALGLDHVTAALTGSVASEHGEVTIDTRRAETLTRRYGIFAEAQEGTTEDGVPLFQLSAMMRPVLEQLLTELSRLLEFYKTQVEGGGVSRLWLCGGGAHLKSLRTFLADGLGVTVEVLDPEGVGPQLAAALGAALDRGRTLNLLPEESKRRSAQLTSYALVAPHLRRWLPIGCLLLLLLAGLRGALAWQLQRQAQAWRQQQPAYDEVQRVISKTAALTRLQHEAARFVAQQPLWHGVLGAIAEATPATVVVTHLDLFKQVEPMPGVKDRVRMATNC